MHYSDQEEIGSDRIPIEREESIAIHLEFAPKFLSDILK